MWSDIGHDATLGLESVIGIIGIRLYEEPRYDVVGRLGGLVEIRNHAPRLAAEVDVSGAERDKPGEAFVLLFADISGANQAGDGGGAKIAMTVPVEMRMPEKAGDDRAGGGCAMQ